MDFAQDLEMAPMIKATAAMRNIDSPTTSVAENVGGDNASQQPMEIHPLPELNQHGGSMTQWNQDHVIIQIPPSTGTVSNGEQVQGEDEVEIKKALKFSYGAIFPTFAGLLTIFTVYFSKATELGPGISPLNVTAFSMLTAFFSAGSMTLLASVRPCPTEVLIRVLKGLKYVTLAFLVLAGIYIAFVFLGFWLLLAAAIPLVVTVVVIFSVFFNNC